MTRRLLLSFLMITLTLAGVIGATSAYFNTGTVLGANTFQTGTVSIGGFNYQNLTLTNLTPGTPVTVTNFGVNYTGSINADLYIGTKGTSSPGDAAYFADHLYLRIYAQGTPDIVWEGYVNALSTAWKKIADNTPAGWKAYDLQFTLDATTDNSHMGVTNSDTKILIYAVQAGGPIPTTMPYLITSWPWL